MRLMRDGEAASGATRTEERTADRLRISVLGSSCSVPRPGRACSGYLVESDAVRIVVDLGIGAFSRLRETGADLELGGLIVSHMHPDHFLDVVTLRYALRYGRRSRAERVPLWLPPGGEAILRRIAEAFIPEQDDFLDAVYDVRTYDPAGSLEFGDLHVRFAPTTHYIPCYGMRVECAGTTLAYSADTAYDPRVVALAADADLFLCEATLPRGASAAEHAGHASAADAGRMAREANAHALVLTHWTENSVPAEMRIDAASEYAGPVTVADDGDGFVVAAAD